MENQRYPDIHEESQMAGEPAVTATYRQPFTRAQREIIDAVSGLPDSQVRELQQAISLFFAHKADEAMEDLWADGTWNEQTLEQLKTAHYRTPYNS